MKLKNYLTKYGVSQVRFGQMCGVSTATINNICCSRKKAAVPLALRIEEMSNYSVNAIEIISDNSKKKLKLARTYNLTDKTDGIHRNQEKL